jgi:alpha-glucosidase (family GH31 glycosyl hydrolase)
MEYSPTDTFEDRPSQAFWYRKQPVPPFKVTQNEQSIEIDTGELHLVYQITPRGFTRETLSVDVKATGTTWHYGDNDWYNLKGTGRTLDEADGAINLEPGLVSRSGFSVVDDSQSLVFDSDGWLEARTSEKNRNLDLYFFGYGHDYAACLQDYFKVSGNVPLVPRWILGNWWSRYWEYTQESLMDLMTEFKKRDVPLSVCIIDMDWHITKTGNDSSGWTGYSWNREWFPNPPALFEWLHKMGLRTAMNLHPADGVWSHEEMYPQLAEKMGIDPASERPVAFDIADPEFAKHYFEILHHPYEEMGVDFWWMDWQQGKKITNSRHPVGEVLDPLWWLNHLHFHDLGRGGKKRSFVFSRWGGLGNHRYPIGFSGDSVTSWKSLAFQPTFTSTAANVGFGWWSHDIGGHMFGIEEAELYTRWVQYGVFSPIFRLHCTKNPYQDRAPWSFGEDAFPINRAAMQLRHALIPYIYTMAWRFSKTAIPLCAPMYYAYPENEEAYMSPNQYFFGDQLLAAPFVTPHNEDTNLSQESVWFPEGDWFNFFDGERFAGNHWHTIYGTLEDIPIFARAGAIVPLSASADVSVPDHLIVKIFPGMDGEFTLYEDDGVSGSYLDGLSSETRMAQDWSQNRLTFRIEAAQGDTRHLPPLRKFDLHFYGLRQPETVKVWVNGAAVEAKSVWEEAKALLTVTSPQLSPSDRLDVELTVSEGSLLGERDLREQKVRKMLRAFRLESIVKQRIDQSLPYLLMEPNQLGQAASYLKESQFAALKDALS